MDVKIKVASVTNPNLDYHNAVASVSFFKQRNAGLNVEKNAVLEQSSSLSSSQCQGLESTRGTRRTQGP